MNNIFFSDIKFIILESTIEPYIYLSDKLFDKKINYISLLNIIKDFQPIKKFIFYVIHYLRSYKGIKKYNYFIIKNLKCKTIIYDTKLCSELDFIFYLTDDMICFNCIKMNGESTKYKTKLRYYNHILKYNKLNLLISKNKLNYFKCLNKFLPDDLIYKIIENYIISNNNILYKKVINECIYITKNQSIKYYKAYDKPNNIYPTSWNMNNTYRIVRPSYYIVYSLQVLPYLFDKHNTNCTCDRCIYNIDFPRIRYLLNKYYNPHSDHYSNYYNNYIKLILYINSTYGINYKSKNSIFYYKNKFNLGFNKNKKYNHIILKNNKSKHKQLINLYHLHH